ncbi:MAG: site-specific integrase [Arenimonas sp.]
MADLDRYLDAATRANTRRSYESAIRHFEVEAGGHLPATADQVAHYLADYAGLLAISTLRQRLAALGRWHQDHGFVDPTRATVVRKTLKGIQALHPAVEKQAAPLQLTQLAHVVDWLDGAISTAETRGDHAAVLRHCRDKALVLLGFWRGFRGDELLRLQVEHLQLVPEQGLTCFLPHSKGDRENIGQTYRVPALSRWCPVAATTDWVTAAGLHAGPLFCRIFRSGTLTNEGLHPNSFIPLLRRIFSQAGLATPDAYSGHSLRRGFAGWANAQGWDLKTLMEYVGWRDVKSAMRYLDGSDPFSQQRIEAGLPSVPQSLPPSVVVSEPIVVLELTLDLTRFTPRSRGRATAHRVIETVCLAPHGGQRLDAEGRRYRLHVTAPDDATLEESIAALFDEMHRVADNHQCFLTAHLHDPHGHRHWD